jgi:hypothetical protein
VKTKTIPVGATLAAAIVGSILRQAAEEPTRQKALGDILFGAIFGGIVAVAWACLRRARRYLAKRQPAGSLRDNHEHKRM